MRGQSTTVDTPPPSTKHVPPESGRRKANPSTTRTTADDARLLPRHREPSPLLDRHQLERAQAAVLIDSLATNTSHALPLRHELTKPGDTEQLRGIPVLGAAAGATADSLPHVEGARRADRAAVLRAKTRL